MRSFEREFVSTLFQSPPGQRLTAGPRQRGVRRGAHGSGAPMICTDNGEENPNPETAQIGSFQLHELTTRNSVPTSLAATYAVADKSGEVFRTGALCFRAAPATSLAAPPLHIFFFARDLCSR